MRSFQATVRKLIPSHRSSHRGVPASRGLEEDNRALRQQNRDLQATVQTYAEVIADLSTAIETAQAPALAAVRTLR